MPFADVVVVVVKGSIQAAAAAPACGPPTLSTVCRGPLSVHVSNISLRHHDKD